MNQHIDNSNGFYEIPLLLNAWNLRGFMHFTYQICNLIFLPRNSTVLILKSIPIVEMNVDVNASSENRKRMQVFPTPESPINSNLNNKS